MKRLSRNLVGMLIMLILLSLMLVGIYVIGMRYYASHFFTGTAINGVDVRIAYEIFQMPLYRVYPAFQV